LVIVEALSSGIPVIASDGVLLSRDVESLDVGLQYPAGDVAALAQLLSYLASSDEVVRKMSSNAVRSAASLSPSEVDWFEQISAVYDKVLTGASA
jgi:glycosyltransferase involved in cell wall biosynthesis